MRRIIFLLSFVILCALPMLAHAVATPPHTTVTAVPTTGTTGVPVKLSAFVYNDQVKSVSVTVTFTSGTKELATAVATMAAQSAKTLTAKTAMPDGQATITASITKALDSSGAPVKSMEGVLGTVVIGTPKAGVVPLSSSLNTDGVASTVTTFITTTKKGVLGAIERFRLKEAAYFEAKAHAAKVAAGTAAADQVKDLLVPAPTIQDSAAKPSSAPVGSYASYLWWTTVASFFSRVLIFYIALVLIVLILIRMIVRRIL